MRLAANPVEAPENARASGQRVDKAAPAGKAGNDHAHKNGEQPLPRQDQKQDAYTDKQNSNDVAKGCHHGHQDGVTLAEGIAPSSAPREIVRRNSYDDPGNQNQCAKENDHRGRCQPPQQLVIMSKPLAPLADNV